MAYIEIKDVRKAYTGSGESVAVLAGIGLGIEKGEFVSIFGPNGSGKSTLLAAIGGITSIDHGSIRIGGNDPDRARVGIVFQNYSESLFPWLKNIDNIAFSLSNTLPRSKRRPYVRQYVEKIGLGGIPLDKYPYECSGGEQQLVALARESIYEPDVLLLDEPFASLDFDRRLAQQSYVLQSWERTKSTVLFVSHDLDEAIYMADRVVLLSRRPARVEAVYDIDLPRPRRPEMLQEEQFFRLKAPIFARVLESIRS